MYGLFLLKQQSKSLPLLGTDFPEWLGLLLGLPEFHCTHGYRYSFATLPEQGRSRIVIYFFFAIKKKTAVYPFNGQCNYSIQFGLL